jgi:hypothetical protein
MEKSTMNTLKYFLPLFFILSQSYGQQTKNSTAISITAGYVTGMENYWDEKNGLHLGLNLHKPTVSCVSWDTQLSFNFTSGYEAALAISALGGGRIYFNQSDRPNRYFFNALIGPSLFLASGDDYTETFFQIGYSGGFYATRKRFLFGIGVERQEVFAFKIGYTF